MFSFLPKIARLKSHELPTENTIATEQRTCGITNPNLISESAGDTKLKIHKFLGLKSNSNLRSWHFFRAFVFSKLAAVDRRRLFVALPSAWRPFCVSSPNRLHYIYKEPVMVGTKFIVFIIFGSSSLVWLKKSWAKWNLQQLPKSNAFIFHTAFRGQFFPSFPTVTYNSYRLEIWIRTMMAFGCLALQKKSRRRKQFSFSELCWRWWLCAITCNLKRVEVT